MDNVSHRLADRLERTADEGQPISLGESRKPIWCDGVGSTRNGDRVIERVEHVAGNGGLWQDREEGPQLGSLPEGALDPLEVAVDLSQAHINLAGCDSNRHRTMVLGGWRRAPRLRRLPAITNSLHVTD